MSEERHGSLGDGFNEKQKGGRKEIDKVLVGNWNKQPDVKIVKDFIPEESKILEFICHHAIIDTIARLVWFMYWGAVSLLDLFAGFIA
jgi:hypothetical protein